MNKLIGKYRSLSIPLRATLWFTFSKFLQKGIALITTPIFTRYLSTSEYGLVNIFYSWHDIILIFVSFNFAAGVYNNGINKFKDKEDEFTSASLGLSCVFTLCVFSLYLLFATYWESISNLSPMLTYVMLIQLVLSTAMDLWSAKQRFHYKYRLLVFVSLFISILAPIVSVVSFSVFSNRAYSRILSYNFIQIFVFCFFFFYLFYRGKTFFDKKYWSYLLKLGTPLVPHYLSQVILNNSDKILISLRIGVDASGIYSVAYSGAMILNILNQSLNASLLPWMYRRLNDKKYSDIRRIVNITLVFVAMSACLLMLFAPEFVSILAPKSYADATNIIPFVSCGVFFMFLSSVFINIEMYYEKSQFITLASFFTALFNLTSNYILLPILGYKVAGVITLFSYLLLSFFHYLFLKKILKSETTKMLNTKFIIVLSTSIVVFCFVVLFTYNYVVVRYTLILFILFFVLKKRDNLMVVFKRKD
ncbi:oligosaccharide flippase family protein [Enterococcus sp.]|uniref:lipopolysaccharide biosynthesis protein n=1 Tax=Enterococcus sp. TaxID=35783 RepID=UPI00289AFCA6|nr:oligosaccharide flippase family protein [Enterococcus sp.]